MIHLRSISNRNPEEHRCNFCTRSESKSRALVIDVDPRMSDIEKANSGLVYTFESTSIVPNPIINICGHCFIHMMNSVVAKIDRINELEADNDTGTA